MGKPRRPKAESVRRVVTNTRPILAPCDFSEINDPNAGAVDWLVEEFLVRGELSLLASAWKTGKGWLIYSLILSALRGEPVFGRFKVVAPLRIACFQLEMPRREDMRRFRRLALGMGFAPGRHDRLRTRPVSLAFFSRPPLDFSDPEDIAIFHEYVRANRADLVIIDSALAAFAGRDLNDNSEVRRLLARAFLPLTTEGCSILILHHFRKPQGAAPEHGKAAVLGAGQFGAAPGLAYGLERLKAETKTSGHTFRVRLVSLGAWTPDDRDDTIIEVTDTDDGQGTTVRAMDEAAQLDRGGLTKVQQAGLNVKHRVGRHGRLSREDCILGAMGDLGISRRSAISGLDYARIKKWVLPVPSETDKKSKDFIPGDPEEADE